LISSNGTNYIKRETTKTGQKRISEGRDREREREGSAMREE
jgi:hypothetical protein